MCNSNTKVWKYLYIILVEIDMAPLIEYDKVSNYQNIEPESCHDER